MKIKVNIIVFSVNKDIDWFLNSTISHIALYETISMAEPAEIFQSLQYQQLNQHLYSFLIH